MFVASLGQSCDYNESTGFQPELLREGKKFFRVDGVPDAEFIWFGLNLWITPFVALPIRVAIVRACTRMVGNLDDSGVHLVDVILGTTTHIWKTLSVAIIIAVLAWLRRWRIHQIKVNVAAAGSRL